MSEFIGAGGLALSIIQRDRIEKHHSGKGKIKVAKKYLINNQ